MEHSTLVDIFLVIIAVTAIIIVASLRAIIRRLDEIKGAIIDGGARGTSPGGTQPIVGPSPKH